MTQRLRRRAAELNDRACMYYIASGVLVMVAFVTYFIPIGKMCGISAVLSFFTFLRGLSFERISKDILFDLEL